MATAAEEISEKYALEGVSDNDIIMSIDRVSLIFLVNRFERRVTAEHSAASNLLPHSPSRDITKKENFKTADRVDILTLAQNPDRVLASKYLLCRVISFVFKSTTNACCKNKGKTCVIFLAEDPQCDLAIRVRICNFLSRNEDVQNLLCVGCVVTVRNPKIKIITKLDFYEVICKNLEDFFIFGTDLKNTIFSNLEFEKPLPEITEDSPDVEEVFIDMRYQDFRLRIEEGNRELAKKNYRRALITYDATFDIFPNHPELLVNRATAYLAMGMYVKAEQDCNQVLSKEPDNYKAISRKAKSLNGQKRYDESLNYLKERLDNGKFETKTARKEISRLMNHTELLLKQRELGEYDFLRLYSSRISRTRYNYADYDKLVTIFERPELIFTNRERKGLKINQDIEAGSLVLATRSLNIVIPEVGDEYAFNYEYGRLWIDKQHPMSYLLSLGVKNGFNDKTLDGKTVYQMYGGPKYGYLDNYGEIDKPRIDAIVKYNGFACQEFPPIFSQYGLFFLPSFIKHNCIEANVLWRVNGDFLIVRALRDLKRGEELIMAHVDPAKMYSERHNTLKEMRDVVCPCPLCQYETTIPEEMRKKREFAITRLLDFISASKIFTDRPIDLELLFEHLKEVTDLGDEEPSQYSDVFKAVAYFNVCEMAYKISNYPLALEMGEETLKCLKEVPASPLVLETSVLLAHCSKDARDRQEQKRFMQIYRQTMKLYEGVDLPEV